MSELETKILDLLENSDYPISTKDISMILKCKESSVSNALKKLLNEKEILKVGSSTQTKYISKSNTIGSKTAAYNRHFKDIRTADELVSYLDNAIKNISNDQKLCQYTSLNSVLGIIKSKYWYLGSPKNMNDGLELQYGLDKREDIFFGSFMIEQKESIAMWSMYAQPWEDGVMISIPADKFKEWVKNIKKVYSADVSTKKPDENEFVYINKAKISVAKVAYSTNDNKGNVEKIWCGTAYNEMFKDLSDTSLIGYIKDDAWSYEKEIRLRVDLGKNVKYEGIAIEVPDCVIDSMVITKGPKFNGDLLERIKNECTRSMNTGSSLFYDKLNYIPCDKCQYKKSISI